MKRKILTITGTRADYGLMQPVYKQINDCDTLELDIIVTGMHLQAEFQSTLDIIKKDKYGRLYIAGMLLNEDTGRAMAQSLGLAVINFSSIIESSQPDIILLQGDRGEMLAGAIVGVHMNIPIVHMSGGDFSGSVDDIIRNSISKISHIHLTTCHESTERLKKMGEETQRIFQVGEPGIDRIKKMVFIAPESLAKEFEIDLTNPFILATQHSVTTEKENSGKQISETLEALKELNIQTVFTYPNSDAGGKEIIKVLESYRKYPFIRIIQNLGSDKYLSLMKISSLVLGNSSSGILEAPSFKIPVINIGTRQYNRIRANNVIDVNYKKEEIKSAIIYALNDGIFKEKLKSCKNPYGDGDASVKTVDILKNLKIVPELFTKWIYGGKTFF